MCADPRVHEARDDGGGEDAEYQQGNYQFDQREAAAASLAKSGADVRGMCEQIQKPLCELIGATAKHSRSDTRPVGASTTCGRVRKTLRCCALDRRKAQLPSSAAGSRAAAHRHADCDARC